MIKAIIWDLDGVILDSEPYHIKAESETLKEYGINLEEAIAVKYYGIRTKEYFLSLEKLFKVKLPIKEMLEKHRQRLVHYYQEIIPLTVDARETLHQLQQRFLQGLATSAIKNSVNIAFKRFSLTIYFQAVVCAEDVKYGKPNPEIFLETAKRLGVNPKYCVVVEDAKSGFEAGKKARMVVIARKASHNQNQDFSLADFTVEDLRDIPSILSQLEMKH